MTALFTLLPEAVATIRADGKQAILRALASRFAEVYQLDAATVLAGLEDRERFVEDAPETYYLTDYYRSYPLVLVRLSRIEPEALHDLLSVSWRMTTAKSRKLRPPLGFCG